MTYRTIAGMERKYHGIMDARADCSEYMIQEWPKIIKQIEMKAKEWSEQGRCFTYGDVRDFVELQHNGAFAGKYANPADKYVIDRLAQKICKRYPHRETWYLTSPIYYK